MLGGDVECAGRLRRSGLGRTAGVLRPRRVCRGPAVACRACRSIWRWWSRRVLAACSSLPIVASDAAAARRRVRDRHVGRGGAASSAGQPRSADPGRDRHVADRARCSQGRGAARGQLLDGAGVRWSCCSRSCSRCCAAALGASLQAIRDDEDAAASVGVRVLATKRDGVRAGGPGLRGGRRAVARLRHHVPAATRISACNGPPT